MKTITSTDFCTPGDVHETGYGKVGIPWAIMESQRAMEAKHSVANERKDQMEKVEKLRRNHPERLFVRKARSCAGDASSAHFICPIGIFQTF
jgi:hypothetical protein